MRITHSSVTGAVDTGLSYWYKFKHGLGPGTMPKGVNIIKVIPDGWKDYVLLDKMLTTDELNEYEIKEETPPQELLEEAGYDSLEETYQEYADWVSENNRRDVETSYDIKCSNDANLDIPQPFNNWYEIDNSPYKDEFGEPSEELEGYEAKHLAWVKAKDQYFDLLSNNGIEICELVTEGGSEPFLAQVIHDRLIPLSQEEVRQCIYDDDGEEFNDIESAEQITASWDNPNIFDFYGWYNQLTLKQRNQVDDWCDEEGYPLYDDCSSEDLSAIHDHFESEFAQSDETNFHISSYGNDFNELYETFDTDDPKQAITKWVQLQSKFPLDVMITGYAKGEQILRDYVVAHPDWLRKLCEKYNCPYDPEYLIAESEKPSRMKPSEYTDQLHPFGLG